MRVGSQRSAKRAGSQSRLVHERHITTRNTFLKIVIQINILFMYTSNKLRFILIMIDYDGTGRKLFL